MELSERNAESRVWTTSKRSHDLIKVTLNELIVIDLQLLNGH